MSTPISTEMNQGFMQKLFLLVMINMSYCYTGWPKQGDPFTCFLHFFVTHGPLFWVTQYPSIVQYVYIPPFSTKKKQGVSKICVQILSSLLTCKRFGAMSLANILKNIKEPNHWISNTTHTPQPYILTLYIQQIKVKHKITVSIFLCWVCFVCVIFMPCLWCQYNFSASSIAPLSIDYIYIVYNLVLVRRSLHFENQNIKKVIRISREISRYSAKFLVFALISTIFLAWHN